MSKAKEPIKAPYSPDGSLQHYPETRWEHIKGVSTRVEPDWVDVAPFDATLTFNGQHRGRSAAYFEWLDEAGRRWPMFMKDLGGVIQAATIDRGEVAGRWIVQKRGQNYGIRLATQRDG